MTALNTTAENHVKPIGAVVRWVQLAFMAVAAFLLWLFDRVGTAIWQMFAEPNPMLITVGAAAASVVTTFVLYRNERINQITHDVLGELMKVSWPTRQETQASTVVVIVASIIAAIIVGLIDAAWSKLTDVIY